MAMEPVTIFTTSVTAVGALVSVVKTVKEIKDFVHDVKHVDEKVTQFSAEMDDVQITLNLIKHTLEILESNPGSKETVSPQSAIAKGLDECHSSATSLCLIFRTLGKRKVVREIKLRSQSGKIADFRRRLEHQTRQLELRVLVLVCHEMKQSQAPSKQLLEEFRAWKEDWPEQLARLRISEEEVTEETQQMIEVASVAFEEGLDTDSTFRGYVNPTKFESTENWLESNELNGAPPSEASFPPTLAFPESEVGDESIGETNSISSAATEVAHFQVSHTVVSVKYGLITDGLAYYHVDNFAKASDYLRQAVDTAPGASVLSFDEQMTEERLDLWLCLSSLRWARSGESSNQKRSLEQARNLLTKIENRRKSDQSPRTHLGRHLDSLLLAQAYLYSDSPAKAESVGVTACTDIESSFGIEHHLFYTAVLTLACVQYAKGNPGVAAQWLKKIPKTFFSERVQSFKNTQGTTDEYMVMLYAVLNERFDIIIGLLQSVPALGRSTDSFNYLYFAAIYGSLPAIAILVSAGSSIHARGRYNAKLPSSIPNSVGSTTNVAPSKKSSTKDESENDTALFAAIRRNRALAVRLLVNLGADIESLDPGNLQPNVLFTALSFAVYVGHEDVARVLIDHGSNLNPQAPPFDLMGSVRQSYIIEQPLHYALSNSQKHGTALITMLIQKGADVNKGFFISKPLIRAIDKGLLQPVTQLLAAGADVNAHPSRIELTSTSRPSPLHCALDSPSDVNMIKTLLENGADTNYYDWANDPPLVLAIASRRLDIVELLLTWHSSPNAQGSRQVSPLLSAIYYNEPDIVNLLLQKGADAKRKGCSGVYRHDYTRYSPLGFARTLGRKRIQKILTKKLSLSP